MNERNYLSKLGLKLTMLINGASVDVAPHVCTQDTMNMKFINIFDINAVKHCVSMH